MKKIALSVIGGSLFVAGYYHVHRQTAYVATKNTQASSETFVPPTPVHPHTTLPIFASRLFDQRNRS